MYPNFSKAFQTAFHVSNGSNKYTFLFCYSLCFKNTPNIYYIFTCISSLLFKEKNRTRYSQLFHIVKKPFFCRGPIFLNNGSRITCNQNPFYNPFLPKPHSFPNSVCPIKFILHLPGISIHRSKSSHHDSKFILFSH